MELLTNAAATADALYVLIVLFGPLSGAHFNLAVTLPMRLRSELATRDALAYIAVQVVGAIAGVLLAHAMFDLPLLQPGTHVRTRVESANRCVPSSRCEWPGSPEEAAFGQVPARYRIGQGFERWPFAATRVRGQVVTAVALQVAASQAFQPADDDDV